MICKSCNVDFEITPRDTEFYEKMQVPPPTHCPKCRQVRRFLWRNERKLYKRNCDLSGRPMLSMYHPDTGVKVYDFQAWWSDEWSGLDYGRDVDFTRPFFEQFAELKKAVPHLTLSNDSTCINSDYVNQTTYLKDCYLVFDSDYCEKCYYCTNSKHSLSCIDCMRAFNSELCYECIDVKKCYNLKYSQDCEDCSDSYFLKDCKSCRNCFGCSNLRQKEYCFFNEQLTKEEYEKRVAEFRLNDYDSCASARSQIAEYLLKFPTKSSQNVMIENCTGNYLTNSKNSFNCFDAENLHDCSYLTNVGGNAKDCYDYDVWGYNAERVYECITVGENCTNIFFSSQCWGQVSDIWYSEYCISSSNLFGCFGLKRNKYCILNKQYTKEEYEALVPKIIEHMRAPASAGGGVQKAEFGEFFPHELSTFAYNETIAQDYHPLTRDEALAKGYRWRDEDPKNRLAPTADILVCSECGNNFKIIDQENKLYQSQKIPAPRKCMECRHSARVTLRSPRVLITRPCAHCKKETQTSITDPQKILYCEECYLQMAY